MRDWMSSSVSGVLRNEINWNKPYFVDLYQNLYQPNFLFDDVWSRYEYQFGKAVNWDKKRLELSEVNYL